MSLGTIAYGALMALEPRPALADDDVLAPYRERFRAGMDRYRTGAVGEAIALWRPIYEEVGGAKAYRLAYNLGVAYEESGDATRAAEHYEAFLDEYRKRDARGEPLEPIVAKEALLAESHLARLIATEGRIRVLSSSPPVATQIDQSPARVAGFVAYVAPGDHEIVLNPGMPTAAVVHVTARAGEVVEVDPRGALSSAGSSAVGPPSGRETQGAQKPFATSWIFAAGGATLASVAAPIGLYLNAYQLRSEYGAAGSPAQRTHLENEFNVVRPLAYGSIALPVALAITTATLTGLYLGSSEQHVTVVAVPTPHGLAATLGLSF